MIRRRVLVVGGAALLGVGAITFALDRPAGYGVRVDFRAVMGPPPAPGSAQAVAERVGFARTVAGIGGPRWQQGARQVFPSGPGVMAEIGCAIGRQVSPATTPVTSRMVADAVADLKVPVDAAKAFYKRDRPYVGSADTRTCDPRTLGSLGGKTGGTLSYAYPSGHAAQGRLVALVLGAAVPGRAAVIAAWGERLGDNRITCRVHWPSDVAAGRRLGDAVYARLAVESRFRADVAAARAELAKAPPAKDCATPPA
jgi:acid phosphatase (class A)